MKIKKLLESLGAEIGPVNGKMIVRIYAKDPNTGKPNSVREYSYDKKSGSLKDTTSESSIPMSNIGKYLKTTSTLEAEIKKYMEDPRFNTKFISPIDLNISVVGNDVKITTPKNKVD